MNKKLKIFIYLFFVLPFFAWAEEEAVFRHPLTSQALASFNAACAKIAERPVVKGTFVQEKLLSRFGRSLTSSGNFIIAAEHGMVWETLKPFPSVMVMGNDFILQSRPDGQMSVISAQGNETFVQMAGVISAVFSGQSSGLLENFEVFFLGNDSDWSIGLLPKDSIIASFAAKISMTGGASGRNGVIKSIRIFEQSGDVITYSLSNHNFPAELNSHEKDFFRIP